MPPKEPRFKVGDRVDFKQGSSHAGRRATVLVGMYSHKDGQWIYDVKLDAPDFDLKWEIDGVKESDLH